MTDKHYHSEREKQCRAMAGKAQAESVKARHNALADLHHRLAAEDAEPERDEGSARATH